MHKIRLYGLVALPLAFGLAACSTSGDPEVSATPSAADTTGNRNRASHVSQTRVSSVLTGNALMWKYGTLPMRWRQLTPGAAAPFP